MAQEINIHIGGPVVLAYSEGLVRGIIPNLSEIAKTTSTHSLFGGTMEEVQAKILELNLKTFKQQQADKRKKV